MYTGRSLYTFAWLRGMMKISIIRWIAGFGIELPELNWTQWLAIGFRHENWFNIDGIIGEWVKLTQIFYSRILFSRIKKIRWNSLWNENSIIIAWNAELLQNPIKLSTSFDEEELEFMPSTAPRILLKFLCWMRSETDIFVEEEPKYVSRIAFTQVYTISFDFWGDQIKNSNLVEFLCFETFSDL